MRSEYHNKMAIEMAKIKTVIKCHKCGKLFSDIIKVHKNKLKNISEKQLQNTIMIRWAEKCKQHKNLKQVHANKPFLSNKSEKLKRDVF